MLLHIKGFISASAIFSSLLLQMFVHITKCGLFMYLKSCVSCIRVGRLPVPLICYPAHRFPLPVTARRQCVQFSERFSFSYA
jgi:hypothetical protein